MAIARSLKERTVSGVAWAAIDQFSNQLALFMISVLIARILSPEDYGVIAIVMIFVSLSGILVNSGFGTAVIQRREISQELCSSVFFFNMTVSVLLYIAIYLSSPLIASFFDMPVLSPALRVLGVMIIINATYLMQVSLLTRALDFKKQSFVHLAATLVSGSIGLSLAYAGYGLWSLVAQSLSNALVTSFAYWIASSWRPLRHYAANDLKELWGYSSRLLASGLLDGIFTHIQPLAIGRFYTAADLGFYSQGRRAPDLLAPGLTSVVQRVTFPALATMQDDIPRLRSSYRRIIGVVVLLIFPIMLVLAAVARPFVLVLLTEKWLPATPFLQIICLAMTLYPLNAINLNICKVLGRSDIFLRLEIVKKIIALVVVIIAIPWGVLAIASSALLTGMIGFYLNAKYNGELIDYPWLDQLKDIIPTFLLAAVAAGCAWSAGFLPLDSPALLLLSQVAIGAGAYLLLCRFFKLSAYNELLAIARERIGRTLSQ